MKTDSLFHELFRRWPALALDLAGLDPAAAPRYAFRSEELKQTAPRLDGLLAPDPDSDDPFVFIEVQFQPDESLYRRLFAELFLFLHRAPRPRDWRALVLYPDATVERIPSGYAGLLTLPAVRRVCLDQLDAEARATPGWDLLHLIVTPTDHAAVRARALLQAAPAEPGAALDWSDFIETILVYKLPLSTREEIQAMLGITDIDLKQTRFYQDVFAEGQAEGRQEGWQQGRQQGQQQGRQEGRQEGRQAEAVRLLQRQLTRRFGVLPAWAEARLLQADTETLESWAERLLDAPRLEDVFASVDDRPSGA